MVCGAVRPSLRVHTVCLYKFQIIIAFIISLWLPSSHVRLPNHRRRVHRLVTTCRRSSTHSDAGSAELGTRFHTGPILRLYLIPTSSHMIHGSSSSSGSSGNDNIDQFMNMPQTMWLAAWSRVNCVRARVNTEVKYQNNKNPFKLEPKILLLHAVRCDAAWRSHNHRKRSGYLEKRSRASEEVSQQNSRIEKKRKK